MRRYRELAKQQRELEKQSELRRAEHEAAQFENYLELLVSLHKEAIAPWDWRLLAAAAPPAAPIRRDLYEAGARMVAGSYQPGVLERLFGSAKRMAAKHAADIHAGRAADEAVFAQLTRSYQEAYAAWSHTREIAGRIVNRDTAVYGAALELTGALDELSAFQTRVTLSAVDTDAVVCACEIMDDEIVPREVISLTASGKLSTKDMPAGRYWALYQDHVCSAAIRVAREVFAALPVSRAVINVGRDRIDTKTGHHEPTTLLAVHFTRDGLERLNLSQIDPSDSMKNFPYRMKFKKTAGFDSVQAMSLDEHWVTTE